MPHFGHAGCQCRRVVEAEPRDGDVTCDQINPTGQVWVCLDQFLQLPCGEICEVRLDETRHRGVRQTGEHSRQQLHAQEAGEASEQKSGHRAKVAGSGDLPDPMVGGVGDVDGAVGGDCHPGRG